ncbi:MAG: deoxyribonuclease V [Bradymonadia bacterium]|jgi:deoxyribonuclease V
MLIRGLHAWPTTQAEAEALQRELAGRVVSAPLAPLTADTLIAGCDLAYEKGGDRCFAAVVLARDFGATVVETRTAHGRAPFEYVPGLLSFREVPLLVEAFEQLQTTPDVVICDGQGVAHPRGFGLACHLGLWLDLPTLGSAKSRLIGAHPPVPEAVGWVPLNIDGEVVGAAVRRIDGIKQLYVSAGHRCDLQGAVDVVIAGAGPYRIPEPLRASDLLTYQLRREWEAART